jgi:toxin ParE1/3/4
VKDTAVVWTAQALADLDLIYAFISTRSTQSADNIIQNLLFRTKQLQRFPESGNVQQTQRAGTYRYLVEGNYKIIYSYRSETVYIHTLFDTRQAPGKLKL